MGIGFLVAIASTALLVRGVMALEATGALAWEGAALRWMISELAISFSMAMWLEGPGNGFVLWGLVLFAAGFASWTNRPVQALALLVGHTLSYLLVGLGWWMWDRSRPQIVMDGIASPGGVFHAFPSGHMVQASFAYGLLLWFWFHSSSNALERATTVGVYTLILLAVAFGRLRVGAHWPSDIVGGIAIGIIWVAAVVAAVRRGEAE
ncbi:MAG TPA: phosphatase PAP2 family protein [Longimicrobiaceae bacterium]|nr:phosphatase PAP2 family protein [Longimicrobiaceae bacterium]